MPPRYNRKYKKVYRKKKTYKKKTAKSAVPAIMRPRVFKFKRDIENVLTISQTSPPEGWTASGNSIYRQINYSLGSLGEITDFQNLFKQYRLKGARVRMYFSNTESGSINTSNGVTNTQLLVRLAPNQGGLTDVLDQSYWQQAQAKKYRLALNGGRPLDLYMPLKQLNEIATSTSTTTTMKSPSWIDSTISNVIHCGLNMAIERVDGQQFTTGIGNNQYCKVITTIYLETRGVI